MTGRTFRLALVCCECFEPIVDEIVIDVYRSDTPSIVDGIIIDVYRSDTPSIETEGVLCVLCARKNETDFGPEYNPLPDAAENAEDLAAMRERSP